MVIPKGYKETEIGILPSDWDVLHVGKIIQQNGASIQTGPFGTVLNASEYSLFGTPVISVREIRYGSIEIYKETPRVSLDICKKLPQYLLKKGDLVFARKGNVERSSIITNKEQGFFLGSDGIRLRFLSSAFNARYAAHFFHSHTAQSHLLKASYGSTMAGLNETIISQLVLAFPMQKGEQESVASALSEMDELIISLENLIEKKKAIKQGVMQELLTGKKRLTGFKKEYINVRIGDCGSFYGGLTGKVKSDFGYGDAQYITFLNVLSNVVIDTKTLEKVRVIDSERQNQVKCGDVFFNTSSETAEEVGMCSVLLQDQPNTFLNSFCFGFRITDQNIDPLFFSYYFNSAQGRKIMSVLAQGATRYNLSKTNFADVRISIPEKGEQQAIATILSDMDGEIEALTQKLEKCRQIKQGMMQELLTGRIRLVNTASKKQRKEKKVSRTEPAVQPQGHNEHFHEAVILSAVVSLFASEKYPLGRFRRQKLAYLLHRHAQESTQGFLKKAAGPYNPTIRYKDEKIALKAGYVADRGKGKFVKGEKTNEAVNYFTQWYGAEAIEWLKQFQFRKNDELEVLTTVAEAIADLKRNSLTITVESIKQVIQSNPEWRPKLDKTYFSDINIQSAMRESQKLFA